MTRVGNIRYKDATIRQLAKAKAQIPNIDITGGKTYEERLKTLKERDKQEPCKSYDKYGRLTLAGKARRLQDLIDKNLGENATIEEFFIRSREIVMENFQPTLDKIRKASARKLAQEKSRLA